MFGRRIRKKEIIDDGLQCLVNLKISENLIVVRECQKCQEEVLSGK